MDWWFSTRVLHFHATLQCSQTVMGEQSQHQFIPELYDDSRCTLNALSLCTLQSMSDSGVHWRPGFASMNGHTTGMINSRQKQLLFFSRQRKLNPYTQGSQEGGNGLVVLSDSGVRCRLGSLV